MRAALARERADTLAMCRARYGFMSGSSKLRNITLRCAGACCPTTSACSTCWATYQSGATIGSMRQNPPTEKSTTISSTTNKLLVTIATFEGKDFTRRNHQCGALFEYGCRPWSGEETLAFARRGPSHDRTDTLTSIDLQIAGAGPLKRHDTNMRTVASRNASLQRRSRQYKLGTTRSDRSSFFAQSFRSTKRGNPKERTMPTPDPADAGKTQPKRDDAITAAKTNPLIETM